MARTNKADKEQPSQDTAETSTSTDNSFTSDMRVIVTRNQRNVWQDDDYDSPPSNADQPVFN